VRESGTCIFSTVLLGCPGNRYATYTDTSSNLHTVSCLRLIILQLAATMSFDLDVMPEITLLHFWQCILLTCFQKKGLITQFFP
jgi:hypothetical protein